ncbi:MULTISPECIES: FkbM family methyltransferase [Pseudomonas fluorescens group]|uniref:FkbM family methyltransferase n=1 Tax=Pseudomonas fluorescens group TaxID=136843 RepID=UPI0028579533|nr:FkbM family methyltransferase [Pseudomonas fluorescens]MDR6161089.1 FkbM family methyltransferase [Pseudomonas fluorescens]
MNSIKRNGVDIEAAFKNASIQRLSNARTATSESLPETNIEHPEASLIESTLTHPDSSPMHDLAGSPSWRLILKHRTKQTLRRFARASFRLTRPFARPVLARMRTYFISSIRQEILHEFSKLQEQQHQQIEHSARLNAQRLHQHEQIVLELKRLMHASKVQTSFTQKLLSTQEENLQKLENLDVAENINKPQLDRIEQYALLDANRVAINCGPDETLVKTAVGYVLCGSRDHALLTCLLQAGELETGTRLLIQRLVKPGDVYVDIGANIGLHSIAAGRAMEGQGKIFAFEPFTPTRELLEKNLWLNGLSAMSEVSQFALSDHAGGEKLHLGATSGHHSLYELDNPSFVATTTVDITTITLDDALPKGQPVNLLKIDAEGAEIDIISGARNLLAANPHILLIVELGIPHLKKNALRLEDWLGRFTDLGLTYRVINEQTGELETWSIEQLANIDSVNLLFSSPDSLKAGGLAA